ncbi:MAG: 2-isopropylmalate synthase [Oscillospiraceae bacterium]|nr:2-isopropylmalate synthase [Oscillospiraceae bacterium]
MLKIFDTTLRDGEQSPGCSMNLQEKIEVARRLESLRVDVIEAGFAVASPDDFEAVRAVAEAVGDITVASLARAVKNDIDKAREALKNAKKPRIHLFLATAHIHMLHKLKMRPEEVLARAAEMTAYAKSLCDDVEFSAEDATRSDRSFLTEVYGAVIEAGATVVNVPDTVGYTTPQEMFDLITHLKNTVKGIGSVDIGVHCHNDLGLAVANTLAAVKAGVAQVECTLNGIGERAGNAALEELVLALRTRGDFYGVRTGIDTRQIYLASRTLSGIIGIAPAPNKPVVGANAFAHEAGIHQHGVMANRATYEIMRPEDIGIPSNKMVLGKHSGRHAFESRLAELGFSLSPDELERMFERFKELAGRKKIVADADIIALVGDKTLEFSDGYKYVRFVVNSGSTIPATAAIKLVRDGVEQEEASTGDGPIDAVFNAIDRIVKSDFTLTDYSLRSITEGEDALGEAIVKLKMGEVTATGRGLSTDIIEASIKAYLNGVNKLLLHKSG